MAAAAPQAHPSNQFVDPAADLPGPVQIQPATLATQTGIGTKNRGGRKIQKHMAAFEHHPLAGGEGIGTNIPL